MTDSERLEKAIGAYWRKLRRDGFEDCQINQPASDSLVFEDRVILTNCNGYLSTYDLKRRRVYQDDNDQALVEN